MAAPRDDQFLYSLIIQNSVSCFPRVIADLIASFLRRQTRVWCVSVTKVESSYYAGQTIDNNVWLFHSQQKAELWLKRELYEWAKEGDHSQTLGKADDWWTTWTIVAAQKAHSRRWKVRSRLLFVCVSEFVWLVCCACRMDF